MGHTVQYRYNLIVSRVIVDVSPSPTVLIFRWLHLSLLCRWDSRRRIHFRAVIPKQIYLSNSGLRPSISRDRHQRLLQARGPGSIVRMVQGQSSSITRRQRRSPLRRRRRSPSRQHTLQSRSVISSPSTSPRKRGSQIERRVVGYSTRRCCADSLDQLAPESFTPLERGGTEEAFCLRLEQGHIPILGDGSIRRRPRRRMSSC